MRGSTRLNQGFLPYARLQRHQQPSPNLQRPSFSQNSPSVRFVANSCKPSEHQIPAIRTIAMDSRVALPPSMERYTKSLHYRYRCASIVTDALPTSLHYPQVSGHPAERRLYDTMRSDEYWPHMVKDVYTTLTGCRDCATKRVRLEHDI